MSDGRLRSTQVVSEAAYRQWMDSFGSQTTHLMANPSAAGGAPILTSSARIQARLMALAPQYFSIPSTTAVSPPAAVGEAGHAAGFRSGEPETAGAESAGQAATAAAAAPAGDEAAGNKMSATTTHGGSNLLKYILVPVSRQGVDAGASPLAMTISRCLVVYSVGAVHLLAVGSPTTSLLMIHVQSRCALSSCWLL